MTAIRSALALAAALSLRSFAAAPGPTYPDRSMSLDQAYQLALIRSETVAESKESINQSLGQLRQLVSYVMPRVSFAGTQYLQENPSIPGLSFADITQYRQDGFNVTQTLFDGLRDYLAYKSGKAQVQSARLTEKRAESLLYQGVAQAYTTLLMLQEQEKIQRDIIAVMRDQEAFLKHWRVIGRARDSDVLSASSQRAQFEAQLELTKGQEEAGQELMRFLTGEEDHFFLQEEPPPILPDLGPYIEKAERREDVESARRALESARYQVSINRRSRWPLVTASGNYYLNNSPFNSNIHYDGSFNLSLPLFDGGLVSGEILSSQAAERSSEQALSSALRSARNDVHTSYSTLRWALRAVAALKAAADLAAQNVAAERADYKHGLVTNLDVLSSINALQNARVLLNQNEQQAAFAAVQLEVAAGNK